MLAERFEEWQIGWHARGIRGAAAQHLGPLVRRALGEGTQQPRLADPRLAPNQDDTRSTPLSGIELVLQCRHLVMPPDERRVEVQLRSHSHSGASHQARKLSVAATLPPLILRVGTDPEPNDLVSLTEAQHTHIV